MTSALCRSSLVAVLLIAPLSSLAAQGDSVFSRADTLRGSLTAPARNWWDVTDYDLHVLALHGKAVPSVEAGGASCTSSPVSAGSKPSRQAV